MTNRDSLCIALDGSDRSWILSTARALSEEVGWLKIGLEAFVANGPELVGEVAALGPRVFLDLKLHDIPATVRRAAANCAACGADMITVHAAGGHDFMGLVLIYGLNSALPKVRRTVQQRWLG